MIEIVYTLRQLKRMTAQELKEYRDNLWDYYSAVKKVHEYKALEEWRGND
jgi:hypothetical protein